MKRKVITFFIILISFLLQSTLFVKLKFGAVSPNLMLVVTSSFGFMRGRKSGIAVGAISGLLVDIFWGQLLGFHTLLYTVIGYLNGSFERLFYDEDIKLPIVLISASEFLYGICIYVFVYMLEGDFAFVLYKSEAARFHIEEGNDLPAKTYEMIEEEILLKRARDRALYLLQSQGRTQAEMIKKLKDDGYPQSVTERVLSFLQEYHFIDDNAYTENYIHVNKGRKSKRQITYELQQKGVDRDQIRQMLEENPVDEEETVRALLKKKTGGRIPEDKKEIQKLAAFLGRKGFSFEVISRVLRDVADY